MAWEYRLRDLGFRPSVSDSPELWAYHRARVYPRAPGDSVLALVGGSRIAQGISIPVLQRALPQFRIVQLAVVGGSGWDVLADLAHDTAFTGVVLASFTDHFLVGHGGDGADLVRRYHEGPRINSAANAWIRARFEGAAALRLSHLSLAKLINRWAHGWPLTANYYVMDFDRARHVDYSFRLGLAPHRSRVVNRSWRSARYWSRVRDLERAYADSLAVLAELVGQIRDRGGRVALVHFPVGDSILASYHLNFPKEDYWDTIEDVVPVTTVHFLDHPSLRGFATPDESHIDVSDNAALTEALIAILRGRGFF